MNLTDKEKENLDKIKVKKPNLKKLHKKSNFEKKAKSFQKSLWNEEKGKYEISEELMAKCLFSINKRAKIDRDEQQESWEYRDYTSLYESRSHKIKMYNMKDTMLDFCVENGLKPVEVQNISNKNYLLFDVNGLTFHTPIETEKEIELAKDLPHRMIGAKSMAAADKTTLESYSHVQAIMNVINSGNYEIKFEEKDINKLHYNLFEHVKWDNSEINLLQFDGETVETVSDWRYNETNTFSVLPLTEEEKIEFCRDIEKLNELRYKIWELESEDQRRKLQKDLDQIRRQNKPRWILYPEIKNDSNLDKSEELRIWKQKFNEQQNKIYEKIGNWREEIGLQKYDHDFVEFSYYGGGKNVRVDNLTRIIPEYDGNEHCSDYYIDFKKISKETQDDLLNRTKEIETEMKNGGIFSSSLEKWEKLEEDLEKIEKQQIKSLENVDIFRPIECDEQYFEEKTGKFEIQNKKLDKEDFLFGISLEYDWRDFEGKYNGDIFFKEHTVAEEDHFWLIPRERIINVGQLNNIEGEKFKETLNLFNEKVLHNFRALQNVSEKNEELYKQKLSEYENSKKDCYKYIGTFHNFQVEQEEKTKQEIRNNCLETKQWKENGYQQTQTHGDR